MTKNRSLLRGLIAMALVALWVADAQTSEDEINAMLEEISELAAEEEQNNREIKIELEQEQTAKLEEAGNPEQRRQLQAQEAQNEADAVALIGTYGGSVSARKVNCSKGGKTNSACESQRLAINSRIDETNARFAALKEKSGKRAAISQNLTAKRSRNREIRARIAVLRSRIAVLKASAGAKAAVTKTNECKTIAKGGTSDSRQRAHRCLAEYWDKARSGASVPVVDSVQKPAFKVTPRRRAAEEAIAEYRGSGARRQLPRGFRTRTLPPPSPNLGK